MLWWSIARKYLWWTFFKKSSTLENLPITNQNLWSSSFSGKTRKCNWIFPEQILANAWTNFKRISSSLFWFYFKRLVGPECKRLSCRRLLIICTSNYMFGRAIWYKLLVYFWKFVICKFRNFQKSVGWFTQKIARTKHIVTG